MRSRLLLTGLMICELAICSFGEIAARAAEPSIAKTDPAPSNERLLFPVRYLDPKDLAEKLEAAFNHGSTQTVKVVPVSDANCLLISAPKNAMAEMVSMLNQLDQPP